LYTKLNSARDVSTQLIGTAMTSFYLWHEKYRKYTKFCTRDVCSVIPDLGHDRDDMLLDRERSRVQGNAKDKL
jgi:hypothetical protein